MDSNNSTHDSKVYRGIYEGTTDEHIKPEFRQQYIRFVLPISKELDRLETYLCLISKIIECRLDLFGGLHRDFWNLFVYSMIESSISILYRIAYDKCSNSVTVTNVREKVKTFLARTEGVKEFEAELAKIDAEGVLSLYEQDLKKIRDKKIAHLDQRELDTYLPEHLNEFKDILVSLSHICEHVKLYYAAMCFGYRLEELYYDSKVIPGVLMEGLVKRILKDSPVINLPERMPEAWKVHKLRYSSDLMEVFNSNRRFVGLSEVD